MHDLEIHDAEPVTPPELLAFDEDHRAIAVTLLSYDTADDGGHDAAAQRREMISGLLRLLTTGNATAAATGRRLLVVAYLTGSLEDCKTNRALADRLHISPGRVTQLINEIQRDLPSLGACNRRQRRGPLKVTP